MISFPPSKLLLLGLCFCFAQASAQDLHYSQFYLNPTHLSPASTGVFDGKWRVSGIYRSQWRTVPVSYETYAVAADCKAIERGKSVISLGILLQNDHAGDANLSWTQGGLNLGLMHTVGASSSISLGFGVAAVQRSIDISKLKFKNQWASDFFDPSLPSKEPIAGNAGMAASLSTGALWYFAPKETRNRFKAGIGAFHLNRPVVSLGGAGAIPLPVRLALFADGVYQLNERADLVAFSSVQTMKSAKEVLLGGGIRRILSTGLANESAVRFTLASRFGDAIIPAVQLERNNWLLGISYDVNTSAFNEATNGRGGIEIAVVWRMIPVEVSKVVKCCPVF